VVCEFDQLEQTFDQFFFLITSSRANNMVSLSKFDYVLAFAH
jgi:hypothetical protein